MSSQSPVSTWKCGNCGTENRFSNPTCVLCNNPRPADVAMPSGGSPTRLTQFGGEPDPTTPRPSAPHFSGERPAAYSYGQPTASRAPTGIPAGIIALVVFEVIGILYSLYHSFVVTPATMKIMQSQMQGRMPTSAPGFGAAMKAGLAIGVAMALIWVAMRVFLIMGMLMRWSWARIFGIVRYALSIANGLLGMLGAGAGLMLMSSMKGHMPTAPGAMMPTMPTVGASQLALGLVVLVFALIMGIFGAWYLTTDTAKGYFSE